jgi:transcription-repair coupling factor (superfamily II helicase)
MTIAASYGVSAAGPLFHLPRLVDDHAGFGEVLAALSEGKTAVFDGAWGSLYALIAARLLEQIDQPLLLVCPSVAEADDLQRDLAMFSSAAADEFPASDVLPGEKTLTDENFAHRLKLIRRLHTSTTSPHDLRPLERLRMIATTLPALMQPCPLPEEHAKSVWTVRVGDRIDINERLKWLVDRGYEATTAVELPGEFSSRGGIVDIFPPDADRPLRIELFDDTVESIREFEVEGQRSVAACETAHLLALRRDDLAAGSLMDWLPPKTIVALVDPNRLREEGQLYHERMGRSSKLLEPSDVMRRLAKFPLAYLETMAPADVEPICRLNMETVDRFAGDVGEIRQRLDEAAENDEVIVVGTTDAEVERLGELLGSTRVASRGKLRYVVGDLTHGFRAVKAGCVVVTGHELFHRAELRRVPRRRMGKAIDSFLDLREGDLVVHLAHGIGRYRGMKVIERAGQEEEHLEIEFAEGTKIYVPAVKIHLVQKYIGGSKTRPQLAKIGGKTWLKQKEKAEEAVIDLASEMIELQARRAAQPGIAFGPDSEWQREFDASFPYTETNDQLAAIDAAKIDLQKTRPMDRLLCGDVGFGKTEVAMRAAFKAVDSGCQAAILVPTTILCEQHFRSFSQRMAEFPIKIGKLSRFCSPQEERETLAGLRSGGVDIVIGTHRIASRDVEFHNLGLLVIDEEQRFGVDVKERLKSLRTTVNVLTMSATPIPRTLHMSLVGLRDISNLETPPEERMAVETRVLRWSDEIIRQAIARELSRGGQVYFVHNRVQDIELIAHKVRDLAPDAKVRVGHGQMPEDELESVMLDFIGNKFDILVATTIVESGLDIPNANTIFIHEAERYGLADLHQLRGRVGRYRHRAYAYMIVPPHKDLTPTASRRLKAIEEFSQMGAGFALSMRDLEIRGAGNLLGSQQSGHIAAVGYELYCQLLENAVRRLQRAPPKITLDVDIDLPGAAYLPDAYVPDMRTKVDIYRRLTRLDTYSQIGEMRSELIDRFGPLPPEVEHLLALTELKMDAAVWQVNAIYVEERFLVLRGTNAERMGQLAKKLGGRLRVVDDIKGYLPMKPEGLASPAALLKTTKAVLKL